MVSIKVWYMAQTQNSRSLIVYKNIVVGHQVSLIATYFLKNILSAILNGPNIKWKCFKQSRTASTLLYIRLHLHFPFPVPLWVLSKSCVWHCGFVTLEEGTVGKNYITVHFNIRLELFWATVHLCRGSLTSERNNVALLTIVQWEDIFKEKFGWT